ncbi:fused MFS/spermidine synthase [Phenylobacterium sp.]|uniref:fused MFS/spermidine synthase n=1 Tax=Phenylobacterium sp. TaxID=1871053 RepID=UPI0025F10CF6|nr:fused MFS/spermidine synthase [Phenylobacterium sp.]MBX3482145.1 fused MFS/spermidine synthase [Phenylobacterium sp.]
MTTPSAVSPSPSTGSRQAPAALFALTVFSSAALVFLVQPMVAKLVLPLLGGSPSVWNTSQAFFQLALLAGYFYAHLLQRIPSVRGQAIVHVTMLVIAAVALPLRVNALAGPPSSDHPNLWLLAVLTLSIGAPFAILSATAPLVQAWHARTLGAAEGKEPYVLYAASNLGSLIALLAYPLVVEPAFPLVGQRLGWSAGYGLFILIIGTLAIAVSRARATAVEEVRATTPAPTWRERAAWVALAAIPSSLMLGVTTYITTDVASAPFLWVLPLALYLTTFIIAFQEKPAISPALTLTLQGAALAACVAVLPFRSTFFAILLFLHLIAFFLTALMCHQRLVARRPDPAHLTEFYLCLSLGGVVGGAFNAFVAPVIFNDVWEYPIVLALSCLARPWGDLQRIPIWTWTMFVVGVVAAILTPVAVTFATNHLTTDALIGHFDPAELFDMGMKALLALAVIAAFMVRRHALFMFAIVAILSYAAETAADRTDTRQSWRSFFGVLKLSQTWVPSIGEVKMLAHGTTLHGAQSQDPRYMCRPMVYYTPNTPIGQVFTARQAASPGLRIGAVGLGTGSVAAYVRPGDDLTFFEIDPLVVRVSNDAANFTYTTLCAKSLIEYVIGDARLTVAQQPANSFDILLIDAFSSDAVPAHLLTVEAVKGYLAKLKPDGVLILHLSNRNLDLMNPAQAVARAAGGHALVQQYRAPEKDPEGTWESSEDAVIVARNPQALAAFRASGKWTEANPFRARPWTDDYTNLAGALYGNLKGRYAWLP